VLSADQLVKSLFGDFEDIRMLARLCQPDNDAERSFLAQMGVHLLDALEHDAVFSFLRRTVIASTDSPPPLGTLRRIIAESGSDPAMLRKLSEFSCKIIGTYIRFVEPEVIATAPTSETLFWHCMRSMEARSKATNLRLAVIDHIRDQLAPNGGLGAILDPATCPRDNARTPLLGFPMRAGLVLFLIASLSKMDTQNGTKKASLNLATEIVDAVVSLGPVSTVARRLKGKDVWHRWRWFAPVWAGVLAESNGVRIDWLTRADLLETRIVDVVMDEQRRSQVSRYAGWFADFASTNEASRNATGEMYIPVEEVARLLSGIET